MQACNLHRTGLPPANRFNSAHRMATARMTVCVAHEHLAANTLNSAHRMVGAGQGACMCVPQEHTDTGDRGRTAKQYGTGHASPLSCHVHSEPPCSATDPPSRVCTQGWTTACRQHHRNTTEGSRKAVICRPATPRSAQHPKVKSRPHNPPAGMQSRWHPAPLQTHVSLLALCCPQQPDNARGIGLQQP